MTFSEWFIKVREDKGISQTEAAVQLGVSGPTVCRWENGGYPDVHILHKMCKWGKIEAKKLLKLFVLE